jgi:hypothetical protein
MQRNAKISQTNFNKLVKYLLENVTYRIVISKIAPCYNEPLNEHVIYIYGPQKNVDSDFIAQKFNIHVWKFSQTLTGKGIYQVGIDPYNENYECSCLYIELVN